MNRFILVVFMLLLLPLNGWAADKIALDDENDKILYSVGHQVGRDLVRQGVDVDPDVLIQGIVDGSKGNGDVTKIPFDEMIATLAALKKRIVESAGQNNDNMRRRGQAFLKDNATKEGVIVLESGLQYKVINEGQGKQPALGDLITVHYIGKTIDGAIFGSTHSIGEGKPEQFKLEKMIPGWLEALPMMKEGSKWELYIPFQLAFPMDTPLKAQTIIYEIELLKVGP